MVIWMTGLSGAGKTTLCETLNRRLKPVLPALTTLDGDAVRQVFGSELGYTEADRVTQIKRIQSLAEMLDRQGLVVLVAALYARPDLLAWNRDTFDGYVEIYLDAPLTLVQQRDPKGLYAKAAAEAMPNVVGMDIPWHAPESPDLTIDMTAGLTVDETADLVIAAVPALAEAAHIADILDRHARVSA
jgi:adenylylsulfate kinase-like enzyme